jgi:hypothetical protein
MLPEEDRVEREVLPHVGSSRRTFVKAVAATTAFAAPFVTSFDMRQLKAQAQVVQSNQSNQTVQSNQVSP